MNTSAYEYDMSDECRVRSWRAAHRAGAGRQRGDRPDPAPDMLAEASPYAPDISIRATVNRDHARPAIHQGPRR